MEISSINRRTWTLAPCSKSKTNTTAVQLVEVIKARLFKPVSPTTKFVFREEQDKNNQLIKIPMLSRKRQYYHKLWIRDREAITKYKLILIFRVRMD